MDETHFRKLEKMYAHANINNLFFHPYQIKIEDKKATITLEVSEKFHYALGAMHGAVYFKLLDDSAFFAANSVVKNISLLTSSFNIHFTRPFTIGNITAIGELRFQSRNTFIAESTLFNEAGREIAFGTGHFAKSKIELNEKVGYL